MKYKYLLANFLLGLLSQQALGQATAWRPFRPAGIYKFTQNPGTATIYTIHTLRVDSAYATAAGDSVYTFNRLLRATTSSATTSTARKSRNNLFGARLRWQPGTSNFYLEANAEPALGQTTPVALLLCPRAAVGSTWAASSTPALTATLTSRVGTATDTVATITLSNGQQFLLSRTNGLLQGPQWLTLSTAATTPAMQWRQFNAPQPGLSIYDPRTLFSMVANDELGYAAGVPYLGGALLCQSGYRLRRITSRVITADSLLISYQEQRTITTSAMPGCGGQPGTVISPIQQGRWAFSLRTGASPQFPFLALLTGEYRPYPTTSGFGTLGALAVGGTYSIEMAGTYCLNYGSQVNFANVYPIAGSPGQYAAGIDALAVSETYDLGAGMGPGRFKDAYNNSLSYFRHNGITCGSASNFATLLPSRAALAAASATLHPNPAIDAASLTLNAPAQPGSMLILTDALGRQVWHTAVAANQTVLPIPLLSQPAGLYLVQLLAPGAAPLTWKLKH